jgi:hypothetical protein
MKIEMSDELFVMLYFGTNNARKMRKALNNAENIINTFLEPEEGTTKYLYITNPDGTRFKVEYGAKIENYLVTPFDEDFLDSK